jgi:hypothetical protein
LSGVGQFACTITAEGFQKDALFILAGGFLFNCAHGESASKEGTWVANRLITPFQWDSDKNCVTVLTKHRYVKSLTGG